MTLLPSPVTHVGWRRVREIAADLLIATALIWTLPLLLGAVSAIAGLLVGASE
jgi:2-hydroxychromene-2-carboxylate isomerase